MSVSEIPKNAKPFGMLQTIKNDPDALWAWEQSRDQLGDDAVARAGGRRVTEWTWNDEPLAAISEFNQRLEYLESRVGQPWHEDDPDDTITAEDVERQRAQGPGIVQSGRCWALLNGQ